MFELKEPTSAQLRFYAALWWPASCAVLGGLLYRVWAWPEAAYGVWGAGVLLGGVGWAWPAVIRPVYVAHHRLVYPLGVLVAWVLMSVVYYLIVTPVGLLGRLVGRDPLNLGKSAARRSYWIERESSTEMERYFHQF